MDSSDCYQRRGLLKIGSYSSQKGYRIYGLFLQNDISKRFFPSSWEKYSWVLKLARGLVCFSEDLHTVQKDRKELTILSFQKYMLEGRGVSLSLFFFFFLNLYLPLYCLYSIVCNLPQTIYCYTNCLIYIFCPNQITSF